MTYPSIKKNVIYGTSSTKDCFNSLEILTKYCSKIYLIQGKHERCMPIQRLIEETNKILDSILVTKPLFAEVQARGNIQKTLEKVLSDINANGNDEIIIIAGSFFIMKEVMEFFKIPFEEDPYELNEIFN